MSIDRGVRGFLSGLAGLTLSAVAIVIAAETAAQSPFKTERFGDWQLVYRHGFPPQLANARHPFARGFCLAEVLLVPAAEFGFSEKDQLEIEKQRQVVDFGCLLVSCVSVPGNERGVLANFLIAVTTTDGRAEAQTGRLSFRISTNPKSFDDLVFYDAPVGQPSADASFRLHAWETMREDSNSHLFLLTISLLVPGKFVHSLNKDGALIVDLRPGHNRKDEPKFAGRKLDFRLGHADKAAERFSEECKRFRN